jgi:hypothetical protein
LEWRAHLSRFDIVKNVDTLDAFTRCWTEEHHILEKAVEVLEGEKQKSAEVLRDAWIERNLETFDKAIEEMAEWAEFALSDTEPLPKKGITDQIFQLLNRSEHNKELDRIQSRMYERLAEKTSTAVNDLIALYGLDGETAAELEKASKGEFAVNRDVEEPLAATLGGVVSGLVGGLAADLISGGMTFGGGAIVGMLLGGATTYALARGYNLTQTGQNMVRWTELHFLTQIQFLTMLYLAISHYGRGRGIWQDPVNNPAHWQEVLQQQLNEESDTWSKLWKKGGINSNPGTLPKPLNKALRQLLVRVFSQLYPESKEMFRR